MQHVIVSRLAGCRLTNIIFIYFIKAMPELNATIEKITKFKLKVLFLANKYVPIRMTSVFIAELFFTTKFGIL